MDIRLKTFPLEFRGKTYSLCVNNNVLADVQEENDGKILNALDGRHGLKSTLQFLAAMINDAADAAGDPLIVTPRELGREFTFNEIKELGAKIAPLITAAIVTEEDPEKK